MKNDKLINKLQDLLNKNRDKKVVVIGTTCAGKTTFLKEIKNAFDMDKLIFPLLTKKEKEYVCQSPWTPEIGKTMSKFVKERIKVEKGKPLFGTVLLDCDLIIYFKISDELFKKRVLSRNSNFTDAKNMQRSIDKEIKNSNISTVEFFVG